MDRILDLGCGTGDSWRKLGLKVENCRIVGIDVQRDRVQEANLKYGGRGCGYLCARGEEIRFQTAASRAFSAMWLCLYAHSTHAGGTAPSVGSGGVVEGDATRSEFHLERIPAVVS